MLALAGLRSPSDKKEDVPPTRETGLNVLLITVDTLRADAVGASPQARPVTPWIDRLAAAGVRFTNAHAHNVVTLPSHANILSGRLPAEHGVHDNAGFRFPATLDTLATILQGRGYRTGAFVSAFPLDARFGLTRGFDEYDDQFDDTARPAFLVQERPGIETVARARRWIDERQDRPWFCWVHLYEPHYPYAAPRASASRFPDNPYFGDVHAADAALEPLLAPILARGTSERTLVVVTSDHGEALGDHGEATHGVFAYEPVLKVPLVVYQPRLFAPRVTAAAASHIDLLPTLLDAMAVPVPDGLPGRSLLPVLSGAAAADVSGAPTYFEALSASLNRGWAPLHGLIDGTIKFIDLPIPELYDLAADPEERHNLAAARQAEVHAFRDRLRRMSARTPAAAVESADTRERLRSLGYITGDRRATAVAGEAADPKRLIGYDTRLQEIVALYMAGDLRQAITEARRLRADQPSMVLALVYLAQLEREAGNLQTAIDAMQDAVALAPHSTEYAAILATCLTQAGRAAEALRVLDRPRPGQEADLDGMTARALALARLGRHGEALEVLAAAQRQDPANARLLLEAGTVQLMAGRRREARESWEAAVARNPRAARAHSSLGVLDVEEGRLTIAVERWRTATALDPREHMTVLAVGLSLAQQGRPREARAALEFFVSQAPGTPFAAQIGRARAVLAALPSR